MTDLFRRHLALYYVVRLENTLVMTHGIASCSFLLYFSFILPQRKKIKKANFFSKDAFLPFLLLCFQKAHQVSILSGKSSVVTNCSERQFYDIQQKKAYVFLDSHICNFLLSKLIFVQNSTNLEIVYSRNIWQN